MPGSCVVDGPEEEVLSYSSSASPMSGDLCEYQSGPEEVPSYSSSVSPMAGASSGSDLERSV